MVNGKKKKSIKKMKGYLLAIPVVIVILLLFMAFYIPAPSRVIMVGLDAADWDIINPLVEAGRLPNIKRIIDGGTTGKLETSEPSISPTVWTTISTGVDRKQHGVLDFKLPGTSGEPYTSNMRRVPAVWNILSHFEKKVGIIGHWMTWPAEEVNGEMVSSYISYDPVEKDTLYYKGKLRATDEIPGQTYPPELIEELIPSVVTPEMVTRDDISKFLNIDNWDDPDLYTKPDGSVNILKQSLEYLLPWTYSADETNLNVYWYLRKNKEPHDFLYTYIEGTDVFAHRFWQFHNPEFLDASMAFWGYDPAAKDKYIRYFGDSINKYYEWADGQVGKIMDDLGPRDTLIVLSDHGFGRHDRKEGFETDARGEMHTFSGSHGHYGVIMFYGHNIKPGNKLAGPPPVLTDVLPTVLTLMKVPIAKYMPGWPIQQALTLRFTSTFAPKYVDSYGIEDRFRGEGKGPKSPLSPEYEQRMRSLGYITG